MELGAVQIDCLTADQSIRDFVVVLARNVYVPNRPPLHAPKHVV